jgi:hypothetical protein
MSRGAHNPAAAAVGLAGSLTGFFCFYSIFGGRYLAASIDSD